MKPTEYRTFMILVCAVLGSGCSIGTTNSDAGQVASETREAGRPVSPDAANADAALEVTSSASQTSSVEAGSTTRIDMTLVIDAGKADASSIELDAASIEAGMDANSDVATDRDSGGSSPSVSFCSAQNSESDCLAKNPSGTATNLCIWTSVLAVEDQCGEDVRSRCVLVNRQEVDDLYHATGCEDGGLVGGTAYSVWYRETPTGFELMNNPQWLHSGRPVESGADWTWCVSGPGSIFPCSCACQAGFPL